MSTHATEADEVLFRSDGAVRQVVLNRPKKLNAINENMVDLMLPRVLEYTKADTAGVVLLKGAGGKALSAGGDVGALAQTTRDDGIEKGGAIATKYFYKEFSLDFLVATYPKPYVAVMDGIVMGGGMGVSAHAPFRLGGGKTLVAMPETTIGYYPDVGGLFFLSRLDGQLGLYLALTSARLSGWEAYLNRVTSHYVPASNIEHIEARLQELAPGSHGLAPQSKEYFDLVNTALEDFTVSEPPADYKPTLSKEDHETIDECFKHDSIDEILRSLEKANTPFAQKTRETLGERCPVSVKVALAAYRHIAKLDIRSAFKLEENLAAHFAHNKNFSEGVLSLLVEKRKPTWDPATLSEVPESLVRDFLGPFEGGKFGHITFYTDTTFTQYPHQYGLPSELDIKLYITGETSPKDTKVNRSDVINHFSRINKKVGLKERIDHVLARKTKPDPSDPALLDWVY